MSGDETGERGMRRMIEVGDIPIPAAALSAPRPKPPPAARSFGGDDGPLRCCFGRLRSLMRSASASSFGTIIRHLRLMHACFLTPGPPNLGLSVQL